MKRALTRASFAIGCALLLAVGRLGTAAVAAEPELLAALGRELERSFGELTLPEAPPIYHLRYHLLLARSFRARASYGALLERTVRPQNRLAVELRVGSPQFDNTGTEGRQTGFGSRGLPARLTARALRQAAWALSDRCFKEAVARYAAKAAAFAPPAGYPGDFTLRPPTVAAEEVAEAALEIDEAALADLARSLSAAFPVDLPLSLARVHVQREIGPTWVLDSAGTRVRTLYAETAVIAVAAGTAADGGLVTDHALWITRHPRELPAAAAMQEEIRQLAARVSEALAAPALDTVYVGPVLFEADAAVGLFRHLLVEQLEGTPPPRDLGSRRPPSPSGRLGRRALPPGWTVVDDPGRDPQSPAALRYDAEGTPAQRVELVRDGIVRDLLMSRIPRQDLAATNGHARGMPGDLLGGRASMLTVEPPLRSERSEMRQRALALAAAYGLDHVLIVARLQEPSVRILASTFEAEDSLPMPVSVLRLYADGREERLRGAAFGDEDRWILRDLVAAGRSVERTYYAPLRPGRSWGYATAEGVGLPTFLAAPEVLVGEMELLPLPGDARELPVLTRPRVRSPVAE